MPFASVVPRDVVEDLGDEKFNLAPVGTGPYTMSDVDLEKGLVLERFADYRDPERPYIDRVEWTIGTDTELAVLQLQDGEIDMIMDRIPNSIAVQLRDDPGRGQAADRPVNLLYYHTLNVQSEPHEGRAGAKGDRDGARSRAARAHPQGTGGIVNGGLFSSLTPYYQEGIQIPFDPEGAKQLISEAGAEGLEFEISAQEQSPFNEMAQTAQADLKAIGLNAEDQARDGRGVHRGRLQRQSAADGHVPVGSSVPAWVVLLRRRVHGGSDRREMLQSLDVERPRLRDPGPRRAPVAGSDQIVEYYKQMDRQVVVRGRSQRCR